MDLAAKFLQARKEWDDIVKVMKKKKTAKHNTLPSIAVLQK